MIIHDANLPAGKWALDRVTEVHPGSDGYVRVVSLRTKNGKTIKRPIVKLSVLPVHPENKQVLFTAKQTVNEQNEPYGTKRPEVREQRTQKSYVTINKTRKLGKYNFSTLAITLLMFVMALITTTEGSYNITKLPSQQGLYFDKVSNMSLIRDEWRLVVYYDMKPYWEGTQALNKNIGNLKHICKVIKEQTHCEPIILQLQHGYEELQYYDYILMNKKDTHILHVVITSVVEAEFNILKRTETMMTSHQKLINQRFLNIDQSLQTLVAGSNHMTIVSEFTLSAMIANTILLNLKRMQETLLDTLTNIYNGQLSLHLLTPNQLRDELNIIAGQLPKELSTPIDTVELPKIYQLLKVRASIS